VKIVVDTNIVFSGILNSSGKIGKILLNSKSHFQFYSCSFLQTELLNHRKKLLKLTKLPGENLDELQNLITGNITFINEKLLPRKLLNSTEILLQNIDTSDTVFVAHSPNNCRQHFGQGICNCTRG
jgi:predicted nucleic acid-binding protein